MTVKKGGAKRDDAVTAAILDDVYDSESLNPALDAIFGELGIAADGQDATVYISKLLPDGREARVWQGLPEDYDLMDIARKQGSGDYRVKVYMRIKTGQKVPAPGANKIFGILLSPEEDARIKAARENPASLLPASQPLTSEHIKAVIADTVKNLQVTTGQSDPFVAMKSVAEIVKTMMPVHMSQPQASPFSGVNFGEIIRTVIGMAGEVARMRPAGHDVMPRRGATSGDIWIRLIEKFGEPLLAAVMQAQGNVALPRPQTSTPAINAAPALHAQGEQSPVAPSTTQQEPAMDTEATRQLRLGLAFLHAQADAGHDAALYAEVVADQLDGMPGNPLDMILEMPDPVNWLASVDSGVNVRRQWYDALIAELKRMNDEPEPDQASDSAPN